MAVLPDQRVISGSEDNTLRVWNLLTGVCEQIVGSKSAEGKALWNSRTRNIEESTALYPEGFIAPFVGGSIGEQDINEHTFGCSVNNYVYYFQICRGTTASAAADKAI